MVACGTSTAEVLIPAVNIFTLSRITVTLLAVDWIPHDKTPVVPFLIIPFLMVTVPLPSIMGMPGIGVPRDTSSV